jgi:choline transport protein
MISSIIFNGALGFAMLLALLFCMGDIQAETQSTTGFPFIDIYVNAVGSVHGGTALVSHHVLFSHIIRVTLSQKLSIVFCGIE